MTYNTNLCIVAAFIVGSLSLATAGAAESKSAAATSAVSQAAAKPAEREEIVSMQPSSGINPMTGRSTKYEEMSMVLREKTLEAKIAEQDFNIAKNRADAKKLVGERQADVAAPQRIPEDVRAQTQKVVAKKAPATKKQASVAKSERVVPPPVRFPERARLLGVSDAGGEKLAIVSFDGRNATIKEGGSAIGVSVSSVSKSSAVLNGAQVSIDKGVSMINLPDTHQVAVPGSTMGQVAQPPGRGVVVQGVNTSAVQPMAPGAPIASTQPTRFPADLYNR